MNIGLRLIVWFAQDREKDGERFAVARGDEQNDPRIANLYRRFRTNEEKSNRFHLAVNKRPESRKEHTLAVKRQKRKPRLKSDLALKRMRA